MTFETLPEFDKDLKKLMRKYPSLAEDLEVVKKVLLTAPKERPPFSYRIEGLSIVTCVIKVKKIACKSLKGKGVQSGLRLIYAHFEAETRIVFIELYHKNEQSIETRSRILDHFL